MRRAAGVVAALSIAVMLTVGLSGCGFRGDRGGAATTESTTPSVPATAPGAATLDKALDEALAEVLADLEHADTALQQSGSDVLTGVDAEAQNDQ